jgi:hypothetical protein
VDYGVLETPASSRLVDLFKIEFIDFTIFSYYSGRKRRLAVVGLRSGAERGGSIGLGGAATGIGPQPAASSP